MIQKEQIICVEIGFFPRICGAGVAVLLLIKTLAIVQSFFIYCECPRKPHRTPILTYSDIKDLQELVRRLRKTGAKSDYTRGCGVHVHIGADGHTAQSLRNLANIMASHEELLIESLKIDRFRTNQYCQTVNPNFIKKLNEKKPTTMAELADIWYASHHASFSRDQHYNDSRYHQLNLHSVFTKGTIEFRLFQFDKPENNRKNGLHAGQLKTFIQLLLALSEMAKELKTASPKKSTSENKKFLMRTWLIRLGFVGDEFATAREILMKNLDGDCAFRYGRP